MRFRRTRAFQVAKVVEQSRRIGRLFDLCWGTVCLRLHLENGGGVGIVRGLRFYIKEPGPYLLVMFLFGR